MDNIEEYKYIEHILDYNFIDYLPKYFNDKNQQEFFDYLTTSFNHNWDKIRDSELYQIAYKSFYDLYIVFIYVKIWQIKEFKNNDFLNILSTFSNTDQNKLIQYKIIGDTSLFDISEIKESEVFKFLKALQFHGNDLKGFADFVDSRNDCSHPWGRIKYRMKQLENKLSEMIYCCDEIMKKSSPVLFEIFKKFLIENFEASDNENLFEDFLIRPNYLSNKEIQLLCNFEINELSGETYFIDIKKFFEKFVNKYKE